ncbi:MAG TPA: alpha-amylase family protein [Gaiellaceae bacterium]|nr:alpha-amylase family protein [Gaiellaceae bacterium]
MGPLAGGKQDGMIADRDVSLAVTSDLWWKNAVVYCLDVETFQDSDGDGVGDFRGLTERIDHIAALGASCLWLMPFYPTPDLDDGYDVTDYTSVDPRLGTMGDFVGFLRTARDRGLRVIADFVVNHTSDQHPWFQAARSDPASPYRDYYVWVDEPPDGDAEPVFPGPEESVWQWDEQAGQYYLHRFFRHQPDLNSANPAVRDEIEQAMGFWLELGVSGFRVDAVPYFVEQLVEPHEAADDPQAWLRELRAFVTRRRGDAVLLGEVNLRPDALLPYFRDAGGEKLHMLFDFVGNQALYLALAREDPEPLARALGDLPRLPGANQWARFVRNHDELTLDQLADDERDEVFAAFAPEEDMRIFGRGIRRRLPSMLEGDRRRLELVYSLLFALPGTPVLLYGEEIGMGDNLEARGRMSVRTPMQWADEPSAGFSTAPPEGLCIPTAHGALGPGRVNVAAQEHDPGSLLNWTTRIVRLRRQTPEIGFGAWTIVPVSAPSVFAHRCDWRGRTVVCVHNLAGREAGFRLEGLEGLVDLFTGKPAAPDVELAPYGYRWFRTGGP